MDTISIIVITSAIILFIVYAYIHHLIEIIAEKIASKKFENLRWKDEQWKKEYKNMLDREYTALKDKVLRETENKIREVDVLVVSKKKEADEYYEQKKRQVDKYADLLEDLEKQIKGNKFSTKWISEQYAKLLDRINAYIDFRTKYRSEKTADVISSQRKRMKEAERKASFYESILTYYETLFPWLQEYRDEDDDLVIQQQAETESEQAFVDDDESSYWVPKEEWFLLDSAARNQRALDRYIQSRNKSPHEIGRDYESFIGYGYEQQGYEVQYHGMIKGFEDLGRDLICKKGNEILIIQCKCWSRTKVIREKHINQLFGTMVEYAIKNKCVLEGHLGRLQSIEDLTKNKVKGVFATSTLLSEEANNFANLLGIQVIPGVPMAAYPRIKCNVNPSRGTKIYHLPFDQQYEKIEINKREGDFYSFTALDAEKKGFVRAKRHYSE